ncbi:hypothetical protein PghCCS26_45590 [Paenibacillus glycanilyticus]|uniref:Serine aminopeptidase S33 domain-containing protein n=1 Tax=Paenibacillus glycanilyticus TaxID=126569 RepID=A0ABQ6NTY3_9BACL|nr:alpha/beta hydrolase [Paenibacillus glycanilyticus]GMK47429.1 hypothetical protein PghCCS26_45590 [Paenibacillus glycanilyticus]
MYKKRDSRVKTLLIPLLIVMLLSTFGCAAEQFGIESENQSSPHTLTLSETPLNTNSEADPPLESANPSVSYETSWPDRTVKTENGYLVNSCVPEELREHATTLKARDNTYLSALVLGSGSDGILLAHEQGYSICSFLEVGTKLADQGYLVVIPEYRSHGASQITENTESIDLDAEAALDELTRQGAKRIFLAGASCGGTTAIIAGARQDLPIQGLLILSSPAQCGPTLDAIPSVKKIKAPSLFVVSPGDMQGAVEKHVRKLYEASGAEHKELIIDESGFHGTDMFKLDEHGDKLQTKIIKFINAAFH